MKGGSILPPFHPQTPTVTPKYDVMRRDRLPYVGGMELEYRESPSLRCTISSLQIGLFSASCSSCS